MVRKRRQTPSNVEEVELQPMNVADAELQRQQSESDEDIEPYHFTGRRHNDDNTEEESPYLLPTDGARRLSDNIYPYEHMFQRMIAFLSLSSRRRASVVGRPLPPLPPQSRNSLDHLLLPTTNSDSDISDRSDGSDPGGPLPAPSACALASDNTLLKTPIQPREACLHNS